MMQDPDLPVVIMDQVTLDEQITEASQRMIYLFDFFSDRAFFIELLEESDQTSSKDTPFIGYAKGEAPPQLLLDLLMDDSESAPDLFDLDEGMDDLRIDDLDPDMFDSEMPEDY